jgi:5-methyltetrahydropteroyltriglutamate--homocysteine methyltransferase
MLYRADHVGSLLRPSELIEARNAWSEGHLSDEALRAAEDRAILLALEQQRQAGIGVFTDGEYRRHNFYSDMFDAVDGFVITGEIQLVWRGGDAAHSPQRAVGGKLRERRRLTENQVAFVKQHAPGPIKITLPSAAQFMRMYLKGTTEPFYPTRQALADELVGILRREIQWLIGQGIPYIQLDAPGYTALVDPVGRERIREAGQDPDEALAEAIAMDNATVEGLGGEDVTIALHLCRGNSRSRWISEGSYEPIAERFFNDLKVSRLLLEYDTERAGGFEPLRFMPRDKEVVLGLVTTKEGKLEPEDVLLRRVEEAAGYIDSDRLAVSPQCGFASAMLGNLLTLDEQKRKLELVANVARRAWG